LKQTNDKEDKDDNDEEDNEEERVRGGIKLNTFKIYF